MCAFPSVWIKGHVVVLSHEIVIVRASRRDAHRDKYSLRIHLLFKRVRVISVLEYLPVSLVAAL